MHNIRTEKTHAQLKFKCSNFIQPNGKNKQKQNLQKINYKITLKYKYSCHLQLTRVKYHSQDNCQFFDPVLIHAI